MKNEQENTKYNLVVAGGTFDHLHAGHKQFLTHVVQLSKQAFLGITSDSFASKKASIEQMQSFEERKKAVETFLSNKGALGRVHIEKIDANVIPRVWEDKPIEAIVVTEDSLPGAVALNTYRKSVGKAVLAIDVVPLVYGSDKKPISSKRLRRGEITTEGVLLDSLWRSKILTLPDHLRQELKKPLGKLYTVLPIGIANDPKTIVTVGDVATKSLNDLGATHRVSIVDFFVERVQRYRSVAELGFDENVFCLYATNPAGVITPELVETIHQALHDTTHDRIVLKVDGEEDLAVLPVLISAPLGYTILYGQPKEGVVVVSVTRETKALAKSYLRGFS